MAAEHRRVSTVVQGQTPGLGGRSQPRGGAVAPVASSLGRSSSRRESLGGKWQSRNSNRSRHQEHSFSTSTTTTATAFSRSSSTSSDDDFWAHRTSPTGCGSSTSGSSSSSGGSTGSGSATTSLRVSFQTGERTDAVADQSVRGRAARGIGDNHGRRSGLFLSLIDSEGSSTGRSTPNCLEAPGSPQGAMLPGVEVARRRRVRIAETYEGGGGFGGGGSHETGQSSRSSRSGVTVAHHHHHYHHHHHHHVHHQTARDPSRPGTPRPGSLVRRMQDILQEHRARSPFQQVSSSSSTERASAAESSADVRSSSARRGTRGHGHRSGEGEFRAPSLSTLSRRQASATSGELRGAALEARNRLDERLRAAAHASHSRRSWQAVQSSYDMNLLFSDEDEDLLWSDDDGWEWSLHEWIAAWAPNEQTWNRPEFRNRQEFPAPGRASSSRTPAFKPRPSEGLSKAAINALPRQVAGSARTTHGGGGSRSKMEQEDCPVCLEGFIPGQSLMSLPCNHKFHPECLTPWLTNHGQCPYCRADIVKDGDSGSEQKSSSRLIGGSDEELRSFVEAIERGMDRLSYS